MKITKNLKQFALKHPSIALVGYKLLKQYWKLQVNLIDFQYPNDTSKATISYGAVKKYNKYRSFGPKKRICYAPFTNMHFQMNGDVSACSFNYDFTIGNIHKQTIKEIWFGEKAAVFRDTLANYNLDKCLSCKSVLLAENYSSFPPLKYDIHSDGNTLYPTQMSFEISNLCNYECIMCNEDFSSSIRKNRLKLPPLKFVYPENFKDQLIEFIPHLKMTTFIGGEPLLIKTYFDIWEEILSVNKDCTIHIQTNASYLPPAFLKLLDTGQFEIGVSIDAPDKETFEKVRLNANFDEVDANIKTLLSYKSQGKIFMNFNFCPLTVNWHTLPNMLQYANINEVALKIVNVETPRHLALQYRTSAYLKNVYDRLSELNIDSDKQSLQIQRNIESYNNFLKSVYAYYLAAQKMESAAQKLLNERNREELFQLLRQLMHTNLLFKNFSENEKSYLFAEIYTHLSDKCKSFNTDVVIKNIIVRIILLYQEAEHEVDNSISREVEAGLRMYKRMADELFLLESELFEESLLL